MTPAAVLAVTVVVVLAVMSEVLDLVFLAREWDLRNFGSLETRHTYELFFLKSRIEEQTKTSMKLNLIA